MTLHPPFRWCGSGIFQRVTVWRGRPDLAPGMWRRNAASADLATLVAALHAGSWFIPRRGGA